MKMIFNYIIFILLLFITFIKSIHITGISFDVNTNKVFSTLVTDFNEYAKNNNIDITFEVILFTKENSTVYSDGGQITIDSLLQGKSDRYDIYLFFSK